MREYFVSNITRGGSTDFNFYGKLKGRMGWFSVSNRIDLAKPASNGHGTIQRPPCDFIALQLQCSFPLSRCS